MPKVTTSFKASRRLRCSLTDADFKAFQERTYGQELLGTFHIVSIKSDRESAECLTQALRLWRSRYGPVSLVFYANARERSQKGYVEEPSE